MLRILLESANVRNLTSTAPKGTASGDVYDAMRSDILNGRLSPGERLTFAGLIERYQRSVGAIREGLQRLTEQGLVESEPQRGFNVASVSAEDLQDLTEARAEIEILALRFALRDGDTEWEAQLVAAHHRMAAIPQYGEDPQRFTEAWAQAHVAFHHALIAGCRNRRILSAAVALRDAGERYWRWSAPRYDRERDIASEHRDILAATLARDTDLACTLLVEHITRTTEHLLPRLIDSQGGAEVIDSKSGAEADRHTVNQI
jgi:DNA-binding GntR family transcriptional regulator